MFLQNFLSALFLVGLLLVLNKEYLPRLSKLWVSMPAFVSYSYFDILTKVFYVVIFLSIWLPLRKLLKYIEAQFVLVKMMNF